MEIRNVILGGGTVGDVIVALLKGVVVGFMLDGMCKTPLGIILKPMMAIFGLSNQVDLIQEAFESGDPLEISIRFVQLICMLFGISSQCFTGETLVSTENGFVQISEINVGDYVWTENVETGEKELKQVLQVYVSETDTLVHVSITDENGSETTINTTENHPFYTEGKGWIVASQLENGDKLHTRDGKIQVVKEVSVEKLEAPVKVYNFEVDEQHTYYVSDSEVLVHNECTNSNSIDSGKKPDTLYHYTNEKGMNGIVDSNQLNPSLKANNPKDARYGDGQYLSDVKPDTQTPVGLAKLFINVPNKYKYTHYVEIDVTDLDVIKGRDGVFVIPNDSPFDLTDRIIGTGAVGK